MTKKCQFKCLTKYELKNLKFYEKLFHELAKGLYFDTRFLKAFNCLYTINYYALFLFHDDLVWLKLTDRSGFDSNVLREADGIITVRDANHHEELHQIYQKRQRADARTSLCQRGIPGVFGDRLVSPKHPSFGEEGSCDGKKRE